MKINIKDEKNKKAHRFRILLIKTIIELISTVKNLISVNFC